MDERVPMLELFERALETSPLPFMCVAAKSGRYVFLNQAFAELIGRPRDELMNTDPYQVWIAATHPDDLALERGAIERISAGEISSFQLEKRIVRNGVAHWVTVDLGSLRDAEGRLAYIFVYFRPIDEARVALAQRERLEAELRQAQKLGALGRLTGGVAHDFNNRLVIIMGYTELLKRALPQDSSLVAHADMVLNSAERAAELTRQLLAYSQQKLSSPQSFDLNDTVARMRRLLERVIGDDIRFESNLLAQHPIFSDPGQIEQIIVNLTMNARDAMPNGGRLTLSTEDVEQAQRRGALPAGRYVALLVEDSGHGISEEVLPHIFEPFFTTKDVGKGSGLGLSTVQGIVSQSGGVVEVDSRLGVGTKFTVYLPRATQQPEPPRYVSESSPPSSVSFETVLVCDDDEGVRRLMVEVLSLRAYRVLSARDGKHALEVARQHAGPIQLLVSDVLMPELGGFELAASLRQWHPALKVLFVSGYSDDKARFSAPLAQDAHFLAKPFLPAQLTRAVCEILESAALSD